MGGNGERLGYLTERISELSRNAHHKPSSNMLSPRQMASPMNLNVKNKNSSYKEIHTKKKLAKEALSKLDTPRCWNMKSPRVSAEQKQQSLAANDESLLEIMRVLKVKSDEKEKANKVLYGWK